MDWSTLAPVLIKAGLGTLGTVVGGPAGGALGAALGQAAAAALRTEPTPEAVAEAVKADPGGAAEKLQHLEDAATALLGKHSTSTPSRRTARRSSSPRRARRPSGPRT